MNFENEDYVTEINKCQIDFLIPILMKQEQYIRSTMESTALLAMPIFQSYKFGWFTYEHNLQDIEDLVANVFYSAINSLTDDFRKVSTGTGGIMCDVELIESTLCINWHFELGDAYLDI
jgi:hypothetical protein